MKIQSERLLKQSTSIIIASALFLQGCGGGIGSDLVRSLSVVSAPNGSDVMVTVSSELNAGNLIFPAINLPIVDPKTPSRPYGSLILQRTLEGKNMLTIQVNVTRIAGNNTSLASNLLPNGTNIPVAGVKDVIALQAGSSSRVYLSLNETSKMIGVAVAIKEFDSIAQYVPGANLFFDIPQSNGIRGLAGIFTGTTSGTSGFGIFIDATSALQKLQMAPIANKVLGISGSAGSKTLAATSAAAKSLKANSAALSAQSTAASGSSGIQFVSGSNQSSSRTRRLQTQAYYLSQERRKISVVNQ